MPKSRIRKKEKAYVPPEVLNAKPVRLDSPSWLAPTMVTAFLVGLIWIVIFYISSTKYPVPSIGAWNMVIGFGFIGTGFMLATKWK
ncbi:MAG: cell division protein CrgA [Actinomycetes bacterium]